jgi:hypothetical protein
MQLVSLASWSLGFWADMSIGYNYLTAIRVTGNLK